MTEPGRYAPAPGIAAGVSEASIETLVHTFCAKVREDALLRPIFNGAIDDWDAHLAKLCDFWSSVTLMSGRYKGKPVPAHLKFPEIGPAHFNRWLELFRETAHDVCAPEAADLFISRAERIAQSLQLAISINKGEMTVKPPVRASLGANRQI